MENKNLTKGEKDMKGNFFLLSNNVFDYELSKSEFYVYAYLVKCAGKSYRCFPSRKDIAKKCSMCLATVDNSIENLINKGLINKRSRYGFDSTKQNQLSNLYEILKI